MAIVTRQSLKNQAVSEGFTTFASNKKLLQKSLEFSAKDTYDIFLSHSYFDAAEIDVLYEKIKKMGFSVYIDWKEDRELDRSNITKETAITLKKRMDNCKCLLFITTTNSANSKWCPWELGYSDGKNGMSAVFPVLDIPTTTDNFNGTEFLGIYPYISENTKTGDTSPTLFINETASKYTTLTNWLLGGALVQH